MSVLAGGNDERTTSFRNGTRIQELRVRGKRGSVGCAFECSVLIAPEIGVGISSIGEQISHQRFVFRTTAPTKTSEQDGAR